jgi:Secretion system C-terminal sorting domain
MPKLILIIFILQLGNVYSQIAFFNDYPSNENILISGTVEIDNVYISCGVINETAGASQGILSFVEKDGVLTKRNYLNNHFSVFFSSIIAVSDGIIVSGKIADSGLTNQKKSIWKFDLSGNKIWEIPFGNSTTVLFDNSTPKLLNTGDGFIVLSSEFGGATSTDGSITKFDLNGNILWSKLYMNDLSEITNDVCIYGSTCSDGFVFILNSNYPNPVDNECFILKIDSLGEEVWRKNVTNLSMGNLNLVDNKNIIYTVNSTEENKLIATFCSEDINAKSHRLYLVKFDQNGNFIDVNSYLDDRDVDPFKLIINSKNEVFIMGLDNTDYGANSFMDLFISKINSLGILDWENHYGYLNSNELWSDGMLTSDGGVLVGGSKFRSTQPFGYDHFLVKTDCQGSTTWNFSSCLIESENEIQCFPNPTEDIIYFHYQNPETTSTMDLYLFDLLGNKIYSETITNTNIMTVNIGSFASSIYQYKLVINDSKVLSGKLFKK